jgi:hypothetical protein
MIAFPSSGLLSAASRGFVLAIVVLWIVLVVGCTVQPHSPRDIAQDQGQGKDGQTSPDGAVALPPLTLKLDRIQTHSEEELLAIARTFPEIRLDGWLNDAKLPPNHSKRLTELADQCAKTGQPYPGPAVLLPSRPDLAGLPIQTGEVCHLNKDEAENLHAQSRKLRECLARATTPDDPRIRRDALRDQLARSQAEWTKPEAIPVILQMLQSENKEARLEMIDLLARIDGKRATRALAVRAMVDFSPEVRAAAVQRLLDTKRPLEDYRDLLIAGLRYPWIVVQQHAAEAIAALQDKELTGDLAVMLDEPQPSLPFRVKQGKQEVEVLREVVRVNHLKNCLLCHPPSSNEQDLVRGAVPTPNRPLGSVAEYYSGTAQFVRADVTYLRQDFSVPQPEPQPYKSWPAHQRYDYVVRVRRTLPQERKAAKQLDKTLGKAKLREPIHFALRKLTGEDRGLEGTAWRERPGQPTRQLTTQRIPLKDDWRQLDFTVASVPEVEAPERK